MGCMTSGSWVTTITATYESTDDARRVQEFLANGDALHPVSSRLVVSRRGRVLRIVDDYGGGSKYDAARPAVSALQDAFDPLATSEYYEPWPIRLALKTVWVER